MKGDGTFQQPSKPCPARRKGEERERKEREASFAAAQAHPFISRLLCADPSPLVTLVGIERAYQALQVSPRRNSDWLGEMKS